MLTEELARADEHRDALRSLSGEFAEQAESAWQDAYQVSRAYLVLVASNNVGTPIEVLAARPDVQQALREPFVEAAVETEGLLAQAWQAARELARALLGPSRVGSSDGVVDDLSGDLRRNAIEASERIIDALYLDDLGRVQFDRADTVGADLARRARYSVEHASKRAFHESAVLTWPRTVGTRYVWVTRFGPGTCAACARLHGTAVSVGQEFDPDTGAYPLRVYGDLRVPPRHPNCNCVLAPMEGHERDQQVARMMREYATSWAAS